MLIPQKQIQLNQVVVSVTTANLVNGRIRVEHWFVRRRIELSTETGEPVLPDGVRSLSSSVIEVNLISFWRAGLIPKPGEIPWSLVVLG